MRGRAGAAAAAPSAPLWARLMRAADAPRPGHSSCRPTSVSPTASWVAAPAAAAWGAPPPASFPTHCHRWAACCGRAKRNRAGCAGSHLPCALPLTRPALAINTCRSPVGWSTCRALARAHGAKRTASVPRWRPTGARSGAAGGGWRATTTTSAAPSWWVAAWPRAAARTSSETAASGYGMWRAVPAWSAWRATRARSGACTLAAMAAAWPAAMTRAACACGIWSHTGARSGWLAAGALPAPQPLQADSAPASPLLSQGGRVAGSGTLLTQVPRHGRRPGGGGGRLWCCRAVGAVRH